MQDPVRIVHRQIWRETGLNDGERAIPEETAVSITYNGGSYAVMMATPQNLEDFAIGFSLSEGVVTNPAEIDSLEVIPLDDGIELRMWLTKAEADRLQERRRHIAGPTGCGLCGVETLPEVLRPVPAVADGPVAHIGAVLQAMRDMRARQALHDLTGATHAAGWADAQGRVALVREDVGRHNALDKTIGALARAGQDATAGMMLVSSRASFEMVQKTAAAGVGILAAVSAPTALAVRVARQTNLTLLGFLRDADATIYTHPQRMLA